MVVYFYGYLCLLITCIILYSKTCQEGPVCTEAIQCTMQLEPDVNHPYYPTHYIVGSKLIHNSKLYFLTACASRFFLSNNCTFVRGMISTLSDSRRGCQHSIKPMILMFFVPFGFHVSWEPGSIQIVSHALPLEVYLRHLDFKPFLGMCFPRNTGPACDSAVLFE